MAQALDWSASKVIRIESGAVAISTTDLRALLGHYGIQDAAAVGDLEAAARNARKQSWTAYREFVDPSTLQFYEYEASASIIRSCQPSLVPGLLQTEEYTRALLKDAYRLPPEEVELLTRLRLERQDLLERDEPPKMFFILDESAVRRPVGGTGVMQRQLGRLEELGARPEVSIQILPFSVGAHPGMLGVFQLLEFEDPDDPTVLYLESQGNTVTRDKPEETGRYIDLFWELEERASARDQLPAALAASKAAMAAGGNGGGVSG